MTWRPRHGAAARNGRTGPMWESHPDGVRPVPDGAAAPIERRSDGTVTPAGARELARRAHEARKAPDFGSRSTPWLPPTEELQPFEDARAELLAQRRIEICDMTGAVDSGVGAQLRAWSFIHASVEYWWAQFLSTGDPDCYQRMVQAAKAASTEDAKLRDAAAWAAKARADRDDALPPWFVQSQPDSPRETSEPPSTTSSPLATENAPQGDSEPTTEVPR